MQQTWQSALQSWVEASLHGQGKGFAGWQPLSGDAGFRRYFRLLGEQPWLAVYAPVASENSRQFVAIAQHWKSLGLPVPEVLAVDYAQGFLLVEDLGSQALFENLSDLQQAEHCYPQAIANLLQLQEASVPAQSDPSQPTYPLYDAARLRQEMNLCPEWFLGPLLGYHLNDDERQLLDSTFSTLEQSALRQPQVIVHRDYHSRNLIARHDAQGHWLSPAMIDFQDAVIGPASYDLVSLLRDCYLAWPRANVEAWALAYSREAQQRGIWPRQRDGEFLRAFDWMGLQRHIKVLGNFARLNLRDNKPGYMNDLPLVFAYVVSVAGRYRELAAFHQWLLQRLLPLVQQQPWYRPQAWLY
jgi:N-acetylmuramate 1-kinase